MKKKWSSILAMILFIGIPIVFISYAIYSENCIKSAGKAYLETKYSFSEVEIYTPSMWEMTGSFNEEVYVVDGEKIRVAYNDGIFSDDAEFELIREDAWLDLKKRVEFLDTDPYIYVEIKPLSLKYPFYLSNLYNGDPWAFVEEIDIECKCSLEVYLSDYPTIQQQEELCESVIHALQGTYCEFNVKFLGDNGDYLLVTGSMEGEDGYFGNPVEY